MLQKRQSGTDLRPGTHTPITTLFVLHRLRSQSPNYHFSLSFPLFNTLYPVGQEYNLI